MNALAAIWRWISLNVIGKTTWNSVRSLFNGGVYWSLTEEEHDTLRRMLAEGHFIILTRRKTHLTTYLIALGHWIKTGRLGYWSHAVMNLEGEVERNSDFRLMEATGKGTGYSSFMNVFDCDSVVLLKPLGFTSASWTDAMDVLRHQEGKEYDTLFDITEDKRLSCVELVYKALEGERSRLDGLMKCVEKYKTLTPDMLYDCGDFSIELEIRH